MKTGFMDIHEVGNLIGIHAREMAEWSGEVQKAVRQFSSPLEHRIKLVPATGHPTRYFDNRVEKNTPLRAIVGRISNDLVGRDGIEWVTGQLMAAHNRALLIGSPELKEYSGLHQELTTHSPPDFIDATSDDHQYLIDSLRSSVESVPNPTAIYTTVKTAIAIHDGFTQRGEILDRANVVNNRSVILLPTSRGKIPVIPDWSFTTTGLEGVGTGNHVAYIVNEDLIEYHWLSDPNPRLFKLQGEPIPKYIVVKFGAFVIKGLESEHKKVVITMKGKH